MSDYDIQVTDLRLDTDDANIDNYVAIQESLKLIEDALNAINARLEALE